MRRSAITYRRLGSSDLLVSSLGLGCGSFGKRIDADQTRTVVWAALDLGVTFFDTADIYGTRHGASEEALGRALGRRRDDVVVATKFGMDMHGMNGPDFGARGARRYVLRAVEASLKRLGTDRIDLYQMHEPDPRTPIDETLGALDELVRAGKVRHIGNSKFTGSQIAEADGVARERGLSPFVSAQNKYSIYDRAADEEIVPACLRAGMGLIPYWPLEYGLLTGKYRRGEPAPPGSRLARETHHLEGADFDRIEALERFARDRDVPLLHVAIGGLAALPAVVSVIAGATAPEQVAANAAAVGWAPTDEDLAALDVLAAPTAISDGEPEGGHGGR